MQTVALIVLATCGLALAGCFYMLARNEWVGSRRLTLVRHHFAHDGWQRDFDATYGTYGQWLYSRPFCWNAAKLAGLPEWPA